MAAYPLINYNLSDDSDDDEANLEAENDEDLVPDDRDITLEMLAANDETQYQWLIQAESSQGSDCESHDARRHARQLKIKPGPTLSPTTSRTTDLPC